MVINHHSPKSFFLHLRIVRYCFVIRGDHKLTIIVRRLRLRPQSWLVLVAGMGINGMAVHLDNVLLSGRSDSGSGNLVNRELSSGSSNGGSRVAQGSVAATSIRGATRTVLVIRVHSAMFFLDNICLLLVEKADLGFLHVPGSAKNHS